MSKFSNFLVFLISIILLIVVGVAMVQRCVPTRKQKPVDAMVLPQSDLPQMVIGSPDAFNAQLDSLFKEGGLKKVGDHVAKEFAPGRALMLASSHKSEPSRKFISLDRELRRCDAEGVVKVTDPPIVPRASATLRMNGRTSSQSWSRLRLETPFILTVWCMEKEK